MKAERRRKIRKKWQMEGREGEMKAERRRKMRKKWQMEGREGK